MQAIMQELKNYTDRKLESQDVSKEARLFQNVSCKSHVKMMCRKTERKSERWYEFVMHWSSFVPESSVVARAAAVSIERRLPLVQSYL